MRMPQGRNRVWLKRLGILQHITQQARNIIRYHPGRGDVARERALNRMVIICAFFRRVLGIFFPAFFQRGNEKKFFFTSSACETCVEAIA